MIRHLYVTDYIFLQETDLGGEFLIAPLEKTDRDNDENSSTAKTNRNAKNIGEATIKDNIKS